MRLPRKTTTGVAAASRATRGRLIVIGLGLLGSHLVAHLARLGSILRELVLIDPDHYDRSNLAGQDITPRAVGRRKVTVQAQRLRELRPDLTVRSFARRVESVPLGALRADALVSCLDSRRARQRVNEIAWRLGVPWIDAGVRAEQRLVRVSAHRSVADAPCLECSWHERDYATLEVVQSCARREHPTGGSSSLGAVAAGLLALECEKLLTGQQESVLFSRQVIFELDHHHLDETRFVRNPSCRFDHERWTAERVEIDLRGTSPRDLLARGGRLLGEDVELRVGDDAITSELVCVRCATAVQRSQIVGRCPRQQARCPVCGRERVPNPLRTHEWIGGDAPGAILDRPLAELRFGEGDIVTLRGRHGLQRLELRHSRQRRPSKESSR